MSLPCDECCKIENGSIVSRSENKRTFRLHNPENREIKVCEVDGCLIKSGKRCDYLFLLSNRAFLVELKGKNRNRALCQLIETAEALDSRSFQGVVKTYIVTSRTPKIDTDWQAALQNLKRRYRNAGCRLPEQRNSRITIQV